ncbi:Protein of unknown function [bacterium JGI 053]|nr:Protein of unknown function [bacterium JGI 053]
MSDIGKTLEAVRRRMNEFIHVAEPREEDWVVLSNLVNPDGTPVEATRGKLVMFLAGIQKEAGPGTAAVPGQPSAVPPPIYVDLYVLLLANFFDASYPEGLGIISKVISFFQQNPSFTHDSLPDLPPEVDRLTWEMTNLDPPSLRSLMGLAGIEYLPSVYYKVRMLPFASGAVQHQEPGVQGSQPPGDPG